MEAYFPADDRRWPTGPYLQVAVLPDFRKDVDLARLVDTAHAVLTSYSSLALVPRRWMHITVQAFLHRPAAEIPERRTAALITGLADAVADLPSFQLHVGSLLAGGTGVAADSHPDHKVDVVFERVRDVGRRVFGEAAVAKDSRPAHMAVAYGRGADDSGRMQSQIRRRIRPSHATLTVDAIHLVIVTPDPSAGLFRWTRLRRLPLAPAEVTRRDPSVVR